MNDCFKAFQEGLKRTPHDPFLQAGVELLSSATSKAVPPLVQEFYDFCQSEIRRFLGPQFSLPYSFQKGWIHNVSIAKSMVTWVLSGRNGSPQKLPRPKVAPPPPAPTNETSNLMNATGQTDLIPPSESDQLNQELQLFSPAEMKILKVAWWIFEQLAGIPQGQGFISITALQQQIQQKQSHQFTSPSVQTPSTQPPTQTQPQTPLPPPPHSSSSSSSPPQFYNQSTSSQKNFGSIPFLKQQQQQRPSPSPSSRYYDSQMEVGRQLFEALKEAPSYYNFEGMDFRIIVPARTSLARQTKERLTALLWEMLLTRSTHVTPQEKETLRLLVQKTYLLSSSNMSPTSSTSILDKTSRFDHNNPIWRHFDAIQSELNSKVLSSRMFPKGGIAAHQKYLDLCQAVYGVNPKTGKRQLVLIIADECHSGIGRNGQVDIFLNGAKHRNGKWPNIFNPLCQPNVFIVNVSATGWNHQVIPYRKIITWTEFPKSYVSLETYLQPHPSQSGTASAYNDNNSSANSNSNNNNNNNNLTEQVNLTNIPRCNPNIAYPLHPQQGGKYTLVSSVLDGRIAYFRKLSWGDPDIPILMPSITLMSDYALAFLMAAGYQPAIRPSPETLRVINHMMGSGDITTKSKHCDSTTTAETDIILIRIQRNGIQAVFTYWLKLFRSILPQTSHQARIRSFKIVCPGLSSKHSEIQLKNSSFEAALQGHRAICLVVEKARMGDTIPGLSFFDLRARYQKADQSSFSSFLQDAGRCFGYKVTPPVMILSQEGYRLLTGQTSYLDFYLQRTKMPLNQIPGLIFPSPSSEAVRQKDIVCESVEGEGIIVAKKDVSLRASNQSMWTRVFENNNDQVVLEHVKTNRFLLLAQPQCGKTGAFINLIERLFLDKILGLFSKMQNET
jgi:hypothetical protein